MDLITLGNLAAAAMAVIALLGILYKTILRPFGKWVTNTLGPLLALTDAIPAINQSLQDLTTKVDTIAAQVFPNGGGSMVDSLQRIENQVSILSTSHELSLIESGTATFLTDDLGRIVEVNREFAKMLQRSESELLGYGWLNSLDSESMEEVEFVTNSAIHRVPPSEFTSVATFINSSGDKLHRRIQGYPLFNRKKVFQGFRVFIRPVPTSIP